MVHTKIVGKVYPHSSVSGLVYSELLDRLRDISSTSPEVNQYMTGEIDFVVIIPETVGDALDTIGDVISNVEVTARVALGAIAGIKDVYIEAHQI